MMVKHTPWDGESKPVEDELRRRFQAEGMSPYAWSNAPGDTYAAHSHGYHKVIYCVRGNIRFDLPETGGSVELQPGDRLDLPAGTSHSALVGRAGVLCLEGHR
jgi:quercetin dioxygenase-like cupin family protein